MADIFSSLISAGSSLLGGLFGKSSAEKQQEKNIALQKEFAQSGIQWKVEDAKRAGIHPLYALGASTASFAPQTIGDPFAAAIPEAGNAIARGVHSTMSGEQRGASKVMESLAIERAQLQNEGLKLDLLASRDKLLNQAGTGKPVPTGVVPQESSVDANPRVFIAGKEIEMDPNYSPGQTYENAWSDVGMIPAARKMVADLERTYGKSFGGLIWDWLNRHSEELNRTLAGPAASVYDRKRPGIPRYDYLKGRRF